MSHQTNRKILTKYSIPGTACRPERGVVRTGNSSGRVREADGRSHRAHRKERSKNDTANARPWYVTPTDLFKLEGDGDFVKQHSSGEKANTCSLMVSPAKLTENIDAEISRSHLDAPT